MSDGRRREDQDRIERALAQHPGQKQQAGEHERKVVEDKVLSATLASRPEWNTQHLDLVQVTLTLGPSGAITFDYFAIRIVGLAGSNHDVVSLLVQHAHDVIDNETFGPEILAQYQQSQLRLTSARSH